MFEYWWIYIYIYIYIYDKFYYEMLLVLLKGKAGVPVREVRHGMCFTRGVLTTSLTLHSYIASCGRSRGGCVFGDVIDIFRNSLCIDIFAPSCLDSLCLTPSPQTPELWGSPLGQNLFAPLRLTPSKFLSWICHRLLLNIEDFI